MTKKQSILFLVMGVFYALGGLYLAYAAMVMARENQLGLATLFALGTGVMVALATLCGVILMTSRRYTLWGFEGLTPLNSLELWGSEITLPSHRRTSRAPRWSTAQKETAFFAVLWMVSLIGVTIYGIRDGSSIGHLALVWGVSIAVYAVIAALYLLPDLLRRREQEYR